MIRDGQMKFEKTNLHSNGHTLRIMCVCVFVRTNRKKVETMVMMYRKKKQNTISNWIRFFSFVFPFGPVVGPSYQTNDNDNDYL